jgi:hypothetical protein
MPAYREVFLEKDEPVAVQPSLEDVLRPGTEEDEVVARGLRRRAVEFQHCFTYSGGLTAARTFSRRHNSPLASLGVAGRGGLIPAVRACHVRKDKPAPVQSSLKDLLRAETQEDTAQPRRYCRFICSIFLEAK